MYPKIGKAFVRQYNKLFFNFTKSYPIGTDRVLIEMVAIKADNVVTVPMKL